MLVEWKNVDNNPVWPNSSVSLAERKWESAWRGESAGSVVQQVLGKESRDVLSDLETKWRTCRQ